jgi:uncharacterized protein (TIGR02001 family)
MNSKYLMILPALILAPSVSVAQVSANFGWVSDYIFRGVFQEDSSPSAGIDYENGSGFYIGTWGADVGDGLETDVYFGYGSETGDVSWGIGYRGYYYTDDFDDTYTEVNLNLGYGDFALDVAIGEWDGFGFSQDYRFTSVSYEMENGPYFLYGSWGDQFDGDYIEIGYSFDFQGVDLSIQLIASSDADDPGSSIALSQDSPFSEYALVFGISKGIDIGGD